MEGVRILTSDVQVRPLWRKAPLFMDAIKFHESVFALPFAYIGMTLAADGFPGWRTFAWITVAMVSARTVGMSANRVIDRHIDAMNPRSADRHLPRGLLSAPEMSGLAVVSFGVLLFAAFRVALPPLPRVSVLPLPPLRVVGTTRPPALTTLGVLPLAAFRVVGEALSLLGVAPLPPRRVVGDPFSSPRVAPFPLVRGSPRTARTGILVSR